MLAVAPERQFQDDGYSRDTGSSFSFSSRRTPIVDAAAHRRRSRCFPICRRAVCRRGFERRSSKASQAADIMHWPGSGDIIQSHIPPLPPFEPGTTVRQDRPGWLYGAFLLNRFTEWGPTRPRPDDSLPVIDQQAVPGADEETGLRILRNLVNCCKKADVGSCGDLRFRKIQNSHRAVNVPYGVIPSALKCAFSVLPKNASVRA